MSRLRSAFCTFKLIFIFIAIVSISGLVNAATIYGLQSGGQIIGFDSTSGSSLGQFGVARADSGLAFSPTVVPIPSTVWLFGSGLVGLIGMARKKTAHY